MNEGIRCSIIRGGTSKGLYLLEEDLPPAGPARDHVLLNLMGSPDKKQINGLGGGTSVTSKVAILAPSKHPFADVDYTFAQVSVDKPIVSYKGNCGNILAGVGPFVLDSGLVPIQGDVTRVRIFNTNTNSVINETVVTRNGKVCYSGNYQIAGVPGMASPIVIETEKPHGTISEQLLPTGHAVDELDVPGIGKLKVSIVDVTNPLLFVRASELGLTGTELPARIDSDQELLDKLERIRGVAAQYLGLLDDYRNSSTVSPTIPKLTLVAAPETYQNVNGREIKDTDVDLVGRMMSMQKAHPTYAMTGALCTVAAAAIPGTVVNQVMRPEAKMDQFRIGHPGGVIEVGAETTFNDGKVEIQKVFGYRTARMLMTGVAFFENSACETETARRK